MEQPGVPAQTVPEAFIARSYPIAAEPDERASGRGPRRHPLLLGGVSQTQTRTLWQSNTAFSDDHLLTTARAHTEPCTGTRQSYPAFAVG